MAVPFSQLSIPMAVMSDSYKATHFQMYPECKEIVAYGEFRAPFQGITGDNRFVFYGMRWLIETYVNRKWTMEDIEKADLFYSTHNAGNTPFPWPKDLFVKFIKENNGYFPVKIEALPEGTVAHIHTPVYQITAKGEYARLATFLETILTMVWYPTTVATLSRLTKDIIEEGFRKTVDEDSMWLVHNRLHDFGFRGCSSVESSMIGGSAHLLNFVGSDTMSACYYVQFALNNGKPVGSSIPATEHSVMTSWPSERDAILNMIDKYGDGVFACVLDSYDYANCLNKVIPSIVPEKNKKKGLLVMRPDSGDPVEAVIMGLEAGERAFGTTKNKKGYKVINGASVIQGDGINIHTVRAILEKAEQLGYSAQNIAYGMGGGLLQKVNRDTMSFATKLSRIEYMDGRKRDVMKMPKSDMSKVSLPGILRVKRDPNTGLEVVYPREDGDQSYDSNDILRVVYDHGPVNGVWDKDFDTIRNRVAEQWARAPKIYDPISAPLKDKISKWIQEQQKFLAELYK